MPAAQRVAAGSTKSVNSRSDSACASRIRKFVVVITMTIRRSGTTMTLLPPLPLISQVASPAAASPSAGASVVGRPVTDALVPAPARAVVPLTDVPSTNFSRAGKRFSHQK